MWSSVSGQRLCGRALSNMLSFVCADRGFYVASPGKREPSSFLFIQYDNIEVLYSIMQS